MTNFTTQHKSLQGYVDEQTGSKEIPPPNQLYLFTNPVHRPFLLTKNILFSTTSTKVASAIRNTNKLKRYRAIKIWIAQILVGIGFLAALVIVYLHLSDTYRQFLHLTPWFNTVFWISLIGAMLLWHEYYGNSGQTVHLPHTSELSDSEIKEIREHGLDYEKLVREDILSYVNPDVMSIIISATSGQGDESLQVSYYRLLLSLLQHRRIQFINKHANDLFNTESFREHNVNDQTLPAYPVVTLRSILTTAMQEALTSKATAIGPQHVLLALLRHFPIMTEYLQKRGAKYEILQKGVQYYDDRLKRLARTHIFDPYVPYYRTGGVGRFWVYGYTFKLDHFSEDMSMKVAYSHDIFGIGHDKEIEQLVSILGRRENKNILLIGEPGVGKSSLIKGLAQKINWGQVPPVLKDKRILKLDLNMLLAYSSAKGNIEALIGESFEEMRESGNAILYIDEIQTILPAKSSETGQSVASVLLPHILEGQVPVISTINHAEYKKYLEDNGSLENAFEKIEIEEVSPDDTFTILASQLDFLEKEYNLTITFSALTSSIQLSQRYIADRRLPDSAMRTFTTTCSWAHTAGISVVTDKEVANVIAKETKIPSVSTDTDDNNNLLTLQGRIMKKVIGQQDAIEAIVKALKRAVTDIRAENKPIGVFLFLGPTGTGKTHVAKVLGQEYFHGEKNIIRVDMSEYQEVTDIAKLIGDPAQPSSTATTLTERVKKQPFSVVLFDEIEKAHPHILDLFLQIFDDGRLTDAKGETISFSNTIIICTSNIGSKTLLEILQDGSKTWQMAQAEAMRDLRETMRPELLNRFDQIVVFRPHSMENLARIAELLLRQLAKKLNEKNINLSWEESIPTLLAQKTYDPGMGARPLRRYVEDTIQTRIADEILANSLQQGGNVIITSQWIT